MSSIIKLEIGKFGVLEDRSLETRSEKLKDMVGPSIFCRISGQVIKVGPALDGLAVPTATVLNCNNNDDY